MSHEGCTDRGIVDYHAGIKEISVESLGEAKIRSNFVDNTSIVDGEDLYIKDTQFSLTETRFIDEDLTDGKFEATGTPNVSFELSGPRAKIFFDPSKAKAAIVTCGGLCPGLNDVIRAIVLGLHRNYNVKHIYGVKYGYQGFIAKYNHEFVELNPEIVDGWQDLGGTMLGSSRGKQDIGEIVDCLENHAINMLFVIGGDGTMKGAMEIAKEIDDRGVKIAVIGIPKTIDNDIVIIDETFGFRTAVDTARSILKCAHVEAKGAPDCIGLVKLMGRDSGFIACNAALAMSDVNFVLIPEQKIDLEKFLKSLEKRLSKSHHAVIAVAEGAGQELMAGHNADKTDESGNVRYKDIGVFLKEKIEEYSQSINADYTVKYFDPSYYVRSVPANGYDSTYCLGLGIDAVHAAMAGKTAMIVGSINGQLSHVPMSMIAGRRKQVDICGSLWRMVIQSTGQTVKFHM